MERYEGQVNGKPIVYTPEGIQFGNVPVRFDQMSDIKIVSGPVPSWQFTVNNRRMQVPYTEGERGFIEPFVQAAIQKKAEDELAEAFEIPAQPAAPQPAAEPAVNVQPAVPQPAAEPVVGEPIGNVPPAAAAAGSAVNPAVPPAKGKKGKVTVCKTCGNEIAKSAKVCPHCGAKIKKPLIKRPWFIILLVLAALAILLGVLGAVGGSAELEDEKDRVYLEEADYDKAFKDPDAYTGKWIKTSGQVFNVDREGDLLAFQMWRDTDNDEGCIVYIDSEKNVKEDDYVTVDGRIEGTFTGENAFGGTVSAMEIKAASFEKTDYITAMAPAIETKDVNKSVEGAGATLTVSKIEYAKDETRIYVDVKNDSQYEISAYTNGAAVIQDGKQYDAEYSEGDYPEISEVAAGASKDGIICVGPLDPKKEIKLTVESYSDDPDSDFSAFEMTIK